MLKMKCPKCGSKDMRIQVQATISAPASMYSNFTKTNLRKASVQLLGVNWETTDFICAKCCYATPGYGNYVSRLEKQVQEAEKQTVILKAQARQRLALKAQNQFGIQDPEIKIIELIREQLSLNANDVIELDTDLVDGLNLDSLDMVELTMTLEEEFNVCISDEDAGKVQVVGDILPVVVNCLETGQLL